MQRLLRTVDGNADAVRDELHVYAVERLGSGGVLMLDETGCIKKRAKSAGVVRLGPPVLPLRLDRPWREADRQHRRSSPRPAEAAPGASSLLRQIVFDGLLVRRIFSPTVPKGLTMSTERQPPASGSAQAAPERTSEAVDRSTAAERADLEEDRRRQQDLDDGELGGES